MAKCKMLFAVLLAVFVVLTLSPSSTATTLAFDPQFAIGTGLGTSCQNGQCPFFGTEVNPISGTTFDIWNTENAQAFTAATNHVGFIICPVYKAHQQHHTHSHQHNADDPSTTDHVKLLFALFLQMLYGAVTT